MAQPLDVSGDNIGPLLHTMRISLSVLLIVMVACSSGETEGSTTSTSTTSTTVPATTTTQSTTTTAAPTTTSTIATTTTTVAATTTLPEFPQTATSITHGGESWAVYLAVADNYDFTAPELEEAQDLANTYGIEHGTGELACDQGGAEVLGLDPNGEWAVVSVLFDSEADAEQFVNAFEARGHSVVGFGPVQTFCLD